MYLKRQFKMHIQRLKQKIRYNGTLRIVHDALVKIGLNISLYYLVEEGLHLQTIPLEFNNFNDFSVQFLKENELNIIADIPEKLFKKEILIKRINKGSKCLIFKKKDRVIGYTWFNLNTCDLPFYKISLKENEAYLFDAYVLMEFRGKRIAPFLRYQCYKELQKINKTVLYSISEYLNNQSINFKKKLNARFLLLILYVNLFNKLEFNRQIKKLI